MSGRLRLLVDLDEVVYGWNWRLDAGMDAYPCLADVPRLPGRVTWDLFEGLTGEQRLAMQYILNEPGYYRQLALLPGAKETILALVEAGHDVYFVSTVYASNPTCADDKLYSVERDFGRTLRHRTILTDDKTLVRGDILIDDRPVIEGEAVPEWRRIVFDQPYNQDVPGTRLKGWNMTDVNFAIIEAVVRG